MQFRKLRSQGLWLTVKSTVQIRLRLIPGAGAPTASTTTLLGNPVCSHGYCLRIPALVTNSSNTKKVLTPGSCNCPGHITLWDRSSILDRLYGGCGLPCTNGHSTFSRGLRWAFLLYSVSAHVSAWKVSSSMRVRSCGCPYKL